MPAKAGDPSERWACAGCDQQMVATIIPIMCERCEIAKYCTSNCRTNHLNIHIKSCVDGDVENKTNRKIAELMVANVFSFSPLSKLFFNGCLANNGITVRLFYTGSNPHPTTVDIISEMDRAVQIFRTKVHDSLLNSSKSGSKKNISISKAQLAELAKHEKIVANINNGEIKQENNKSQSPPTIYMEFVNNGTSTKKRDTGNLPKPTLEIEMISQYVTSKIAIGVPMTVYVNPTNWIFSKPMVLT